jgi:hypothetical protein
MRILPDLGVFGHDRALQDAGRRNQQLVGGIAVERPGQLSGLDYDPRSKRQGRDTRRCKGDFYPKPDLAIELLPSVLHQFGDFPTGDDAYVENAVRAPVEKIAVLRLQTLRLGDPPDPNVGVQ